MTLFLAGFLLGGCVGAAVLSWCAAGKESFDRIDVFFEGWKAGYRARLQQEPTAYEPTFRSADEITVEKFLETL